MTSDQKMQLYFHDSPSPLRALLCLEECGLAYEIMTVDLYRGENQKPALLQVNPNGKVPALRDGDITMFDSTAILLYLAEKTGKFLPASGQDRAQALSWLMFVASGLGPFSGQSVHFQRFAQERIPYAINRYARETERHYRVLEARLQQTPFLAGAMYTIADMSAWSWVRLAAVALEGGSVDPYPAVKVWCERLSARPAAVRTLAIGADVRSRSKTELDEEARRYMFPQNANLKT